MKSHHNHPIQFHLNITSSQVKSYSDRNLNFCVWRISLACSKCQIMGLVQHYFAQNVQKTNLSTWAHAYKLLALGHNAPFHISDHAMDKEQQGKQLGPDRGWVCWIFAWMSSSNFSGPKSCGTTKVEIQRKHSTFCQEKKHFLMNDSFSFLL